MSRANQWFVPGDGIAREVITADIQRYLGPDALVRPGVGTGEYQVRLTSFKLAHGSTNDQIGPTWLLDNSVSHAHIGMSTSWRRDYSARLTVIAANDTRSEV
jgi:hypothetical protein